MVCSSKKVDKLQEQIYAYNRGMMGVLDGEKAVPKSEQAKSQTGINNANSTVGGDINNLRLRKRELEAERKEIDGALYGNMEGMNLKQLFIRAEHDFGSLYENTTIYTGLKWLNKALRVWEEEGGDSAIRNIVTQVYEDKKELENVNLNDLRNEYLKDFCESNGYDEITIYDYVNRVITPQFKEKSNYKDTKEGYQFEMAPGFVQYLITYAENEEVRYQNLETGTEWAGIGLGAVPKIGVIFSIALSQISNDLDYNEDVWDDLAAKLPYHLDGEKTLIIKVNVSKSGNPDVDIIEKEG